MAFPTLKQAFNYNKDTEAYRNSRIIIRKLSIPKLPRFAGRPLITLCAEILTTLRDAIFATVKNFGFITNKKAAVVLGFILSVSGGIQQ